jgi:hypothetical protein
MKELNAPPEPALGDRATFVSTNRRRLIGYLIIGSALALNVARAALQSVTFDEAQTYNDFVSQGAHHIAHTFHSNNHTLHSLLVLQSTDLLGLSHLSLRLPALIGGLIYLLACERFVRLSCDSSFNYALTLLALTANPLTLDYSVAARGYGLALGFFMAAMVLCRIEIESGAGRKDVGGSLWRCASISLLCCLSVASNLAFAFVNTALLAVFYVMAVIKSPLAPSPIWALIKTLVLIIPGGWLYRLINPAIFESYSDNTLYFGANSWRKVYRSLSEPLFGDLNPLIVVGQWRDTLVKSADYLVALLALIGLLYAALALAPLLLRSFRGKDFPDKTSMSWLFVAAVFLLTLAAHQIAWSKFGVLLPRERTGLFLAILALLLICLAVEGLAGDAWARRAVAIAGRAGLLMLAVYFAACLRTNYFHTWKYGAGAKDMYQLTLDYSRRQGISDVGVDWLFDSTFKFYRTFYSDDKALDFTFIWPGDPIPSRQFYVLREKSPLVESEGLKIIFVHPLSKTLLAVRR